ncbi:MAG: hypothetical protein IPK97_15620 [Ahniella sp.]|nr:hypothetical protein [Ahniella sp.]
MQSYPPPEFRDAPEPSLHVLSADRIGLVLALCCQSAAASHAELCRHLADLAEDADLETQQALVRTPCPEVSLKALMRSEELALADPESAEDWLDDEDSRQELEWFRLSHQLKLALHAGNVARARPLAGSS